MGVVYCSYFEEQRARPTHCTLAEQGAITPPVRPAGKQGKRGSRPLSLSNLNK